MAMAQSSPASSYNFTTLDPPGSKFTMAIGVSGNAVVGTYEDANGAEHGFVYNGSAYTNLDVPGARWNECDGISGSTIVGTYYGSSGVNHGFIYNGSTFTTLDVPGTFGTIVTGISGGTVVGYYADGAFNTHGFIYNGSTFTTLDFPEAHQGPSQGTIICGLSDGTLVGYYTSNTLYPETTSYEDRGFIYDGSTFTTLSFPNSEDTRALAVSGGTVVGTYGGTQGFIYDGSTFTTLIVPNGGNTTPNGICGNTVVGSYVDGYGTFHGFVVQVSEPLARISLTTSNTLVVSWPYPATGWKLQQNSDLTPTNWVTPTQTIAHDGTNNFIIVQPSSDKMFFRLSQP